MATWTYLTPIEGGGGNQLITLEGAQYQSVSDVTTYATNQGHTIVGGSTLPNSSIILIKEDNPLDYMSVNASGQVVFTETGGAVGNSGNSVSGVVTLTNNTGSALHSGQGVKVKVNTSNDWEVEELDGSSDDRPILWANGSIANGSSGQFVLRGKLEGVIELYTGTSQNLTPLSTNSYPVYWDILNERLTTTDEGWAQCGEFHTSGMDYILDDTTYFDFSANMVVNSTDDVNGIRNQTLVTPASGGTFRHFTLNDPNGSNDYDNIWQTGDRFAIVYQGGSLFSGTVGVASGGTILDEDGNQITNNLITILAASVDQSLLLEVVDDNGTQKWQVIARNSDIIQTDVNVDLHLMQEENFRTHILKESTDSTWKKIGFSNNGVLTSSDRDGTNTKEYVQTDSALLGTLNTLIGFESACSSNTQVAVQPGSVMSSDGTTMITLSAQTVFDISLGVAENGLDTGTESANTWYYVYAVHNPSTNSTHLRGSTSNSSPTLPSGFTKYAIVSAVYNNSGSNFNQFSAYGYGADKEYIYNTEFLTTSNATISSRTAVNCASRVPNIGTGYQPCNITLECSDVSGSLKFYHKNITSNTFAFMNAAARFAQINGIQLDTSGRFHIDKNGGSNITGVYIKILSFRLKLK